LAEYYDLLHANHDYDGDCEFVASILAEMGFPGPVSILDIGCGTGQHSVRLYRRGHSVVGIDASGGMLRKARERSEGTDLRYHLQDMRSIQLHDEFDCAICLFGPFSRLLTERDFSRFFEGLGSVLRPSGVLVFDFINADGVVSPHKSWRIVESGDLKVIALDKSELRGCLLRDIHEIFALKEDRLVDHFVEEHDLRTQTLPEVRDLLEGVGFSLLHPSENSLAKQFGSRVVARAPAK
jgi:SAM-dependent methyltransferase